MSIREEARQEAERRWPSPNSALDEGLIIGFRLGAVWAHEQDDREPSEDPCPEWQCPDLSSEDRREGKSCPDHPCTCTREPSDAAPADALRVVKAEAWDEGADAMAEHIDNGAWWEIQNPYQGGSHEHSG